MHCVTMKRRWVKNSAGSTTRQPGDTKWLYIWGDCILDHIYQ